MPVRIGSKWTYWKIEQIEINLYRFGMKIKISKWQLSAQLFDYNMVFFFFKCYSYFERARAFYKPKTQYSTALTAVLHPQSILSLIILCGEKLKFYSIEGWRVNAMNSYKHKFFKKIYNWNFENNFLVLILNLLKLCLILIQHIF